MPKIIIALAGPIASGKGVVKKYLEEKYGASSYKFSNPLRDILKRLHLPISRENLQDISPLLLGRFGNDLLAKVIATDAKNDEAEIVVIDGARRLADITHLRALPEFKLIGVDADIKTRYERVVKRNENEGDAEKTFDQFLIDSDRETERTIPQVLAEADYLIDNNGDFASLYQQIDKLITDLK